MLVDDALVARWFPDGRAVGAVLDVWGLVVVSYAYTRAIGSPVRAAT